MTRTEARVLMITFALMPLAVFTAVLILAAVFVWWAKNYDGHIPGDIVAWVVSIHLIRFWPWFALTWLVFVAFTAAALAATLRRL